MRPRTLLRPILATAGAAALVSAMVPVGTAQARSSSDCGWDGRVGALIEKADRLVRSARVTDRIQQKYGDDAIITSYSRMEVDLLSGPKDVTRPTDPRTLKRNRVSYNLQVIDGLPEFTASAQVRFDGLCYRTTVVVDSPWVGSTGTGKPRALSAKKAMRLAQEYRRAHPRGFPLGEPVVSLNLLQATTAPPDFGRLRWYVNYRTDDGGLRVLAVYMGGKVVPV